MQAGSVASCHCLSVMWNSSSQRGEGVKQLASHHDQVEVQQANNAWCSDAVVALPRSSHTDKRNCCLAVL